MTAIISQICSVLYFFVNTVLIRYSGSQYG